MGPAFLLAAILAAAPSSPTPEATRARALEAYRANKLDEACPLYEQVTQARPEDGAAWADLGLCLIKQGQRERGVAASCRALASADAQARKSAAFNLDRIGAQCPPAASASADELHRQRVEAAHKTFDQARAHYEVGAGVLEDVYQWSRRTLEAERAAHPERDAQAYRAHLERMTALQAGAHQRVKAGMASAGDASAADYFEAEARLWAQ